MVKRFVTKMTLASAFLLLFSLKFVDVTIGEQLYEHPLETAWKATGIPLTEVSTETWMQLNQRWMPVSELKTMGGRIKQDLNLTLKTGMLSGEQKEFSYLSFEGTRPDGTVVTVTLQSTRSDNFCETQLGVNTINDKSLQNIRSYLDNLKSSLGKVGRNPRLFIALQGNQKGKIPPSLIRDFSGKAFRRINARVVNSAFLNGNLSQKGYTRLLADTMNYNNGQVNVELNTRYDQVRNRTEVIIATPDLTDGI